MDNNLVQEGAYGYDPSSSRSAPPVPSVDQQGAYQGNATTWGTTIATPPAPGYGTMPDLPPESIAGSMNPAPGTIYGDLPSVAAGPTLPNSLTPPPVPGAGYAPNEPPSGMYMSQPVTQASYDTPNGIIPNGTGANGMGGASHYEANAAGRTPWCPGSTSLLPGAR